MEKIIFDTNILIDIDRILDLSSIEVIIKGAKIYISVVTVAELFSGKLMDNPKRQSSINSLLSSISILKVDTKIARKAGEIVRNLPYQIGMSDALIAATAIVHDMTLFTLNYKHFKDIPGLKILTDKDLN